MVDENTKERKKSMFEEIVTKEGLPRYQDILKERNEEIPEAPEGVEYRNPGIMESQIFTVLKVRLGSGRKSFSKLGSSYLSKVCALKVEGENQISLEKIEESIKIDNSVEAIYIIGLGYKLQSNKKLARG